MADGNIIVKLEKLVKKLTDDFSYEELFRGIMSTYGTAKSYIDASLSLSD